MSPSLQVWAPDGVGEIREGDDLAAHLLGALPRSFALTEGDIVVVTSKVVAKAEGRVRVSTREAELAGETVRVGARRGATAIVRNRLGLTMAAAGIDASNVEAGKVVLLPEDPDASARALRARLAAEAGVAVGVIVTDTAGRAWREGQTDIAIGAAGVLVAEDYTGRTDAHGNPLLVTAPAVADELAGLAELATGKLGARPFAVVRGRADLVLPGQEDGTGAVALIRAEGGDFFGFGAREAVFRALSGDESDRAPFGAPASAEEMAEAVIRVSGLETVVETDGLSITAIDPATAARLGALAFAYGWRLELDPCDAGDGAEARLRPGTP